MKKLVVLFAVFFLAAVILLPGPGNGKYNVSKPIVVADGTPLPLPPPPPGSFSTITSSDILVADGTPLPLPPPPPSGSYVSGLMV